MTISPLTSSHPGHVETVLSDVIYRRRTGAWPEAKVPAWASAFAAQIGTKAGTTKFDEALDRWYVSQLDEALRPFAEIAATLDPRTDSGGAAISLLDGGRKHVVTYGRLRQAARVLGVELRSPQSQAEIRGRHPLVDGGLLWSIRYQAAYADKPRWLLLREGPQVDGRHKLEALDYGGRPRSSVTFRRGDDDGDRTVTLSRFDSVPTLKDQGRFSTGIDSDVIFGIDQDAAAKVLFGDEPWRPLRDEPRWRVGSFAYDAERTSKLLAGIAAGSVRMIAEAVDAVSETPRMTVTEADRVMAAVTRMEG
jgi:hypothetical protein